MTRDVTPDLHYLRLFFTRPHKCSYLPDREAVTSFIDPATTITTDLYSQLSRMGFRRSGRFYYAPSCGTCQACIACRIVAPEFRYNRNFRRCLKRNSDLEWRLVESIDTQEHYPLFEDYINNRHHDGDMYPPSREQFMDFLGEGVESTRYLEFRRRGELLGCSVVDELNDGFSAIYTYFAPQEEKRSPGTLAILSLVDEACRRDLPYIYLGYWIQGCRKMSYKDRFQPLEIYVNRRWVRQEEHDAN